jgi:hypothetical protein
VIGLVAAYAVALQALLPSVALAAGVGAGAPYVTDLCVSAVPSGTGPAPKQGNTCAHSLVCLVAGCSGMTAALTPLSTSFEPMVAERLSAPGLSPIAVPLPRTTLPRFARPPPQA